MQLGNSKAEPCCPGMLVVIFLDACPLCWLSGGFSQPTARAQNIRSSPFMNNVWKAATKDSCDLGAKERLDTHAPHRIVSYHIASHRTALH